MTNQAYLLASFLREEEPAEEAHLVLDEAHHLEDVATEALTLILDHEELNHRLNRLAHPQKDRGLLRDGRRLEELTEEEKNRAKEVVQNLLPDLRAALKNYSAHLEAFIKNRGSGELRYGITLELIPRTGLQPSCKGLGRGQRHPDWVGLFHPPGQRLGPQGKGRFTIPKPQP